MGVEGFIGLRVTVMVEADGVDASVPSVGLGLGRCGWGGYLCSAEGVRKWRTHGDARSRRKAVFCV